MPHPAAGMRLDGAGECDVLIRKCVVNNRSTRDCRVILRSGSVSAIPNTTMTIMQIGMAVKTGTKAALAARL
jgi:hypothetical protein